MSVRAYRLIKIETAKDPTFNLWHDDLVFDLLGMDSMETLSEGGGIAYIEKDTVKNALVDVEEYKDHEQYKDAKKTLKQVLKDCDKFGVEYYCF